MGWPILGQAQPLGPEPETEIGEAAELKSFNNYLRWKNFWVTRVDALTGRLHDFGPEVFERMTSTASSDPCSILQGTIKSIVPGVIGWSQIGPRNISGDLDNSGNNNIVLQHIGRIDKIIVNPNNPDEAYASGAFGGLYKTTNATLAPNNT